MKKIITILLISLSLISCSVDDTKECNQNCGVIVSTMWYSNLPSNGDEVYEIKYKTNCGDIKIKLIPFNLSNGMIGDVSQPVKEVFIGDNYCQ